MENYQNYNTEELIIIANNILDELNALLNKIDNDLLALEAFKKAA